MRRISIVVLTSACAMLAVPSGAMAAVNPQLTNTRLKANITNLRTLIRLAPNTTSGKRFESRLLQQASMANSKIASGDPCGARTPLRTLRAAVRTSKTIGLADRANIVAESLNAEAILLSRPSTSACGGAKRPPATSLRTQVLAAGPTEVKLRISLPTPQFIGLGGADRPFAELRMNGLQAVGKGTPGTPGLQRFFAIPQGARVSFKTDATTSFTLPTADLAPVQDEPLDQDPVPGPDVESTDPQFKRPSFALSTEAYSKTTPFPSRSVGGGAVGVVRGLNLGRVSVAGAQTVPGRRVTKVFTSYEVTINFTGGTGKFGTTEVIAPENKMYQSIYESTVVNWTAVKANLENITLSPCGEDVLIITKPELRSEADRLADQKRAKGYTTNVFETGAATVGTTADSIKAFVKSRFNNGNCAKKIDYLILFGKSIPTFFTNTVPNDFEYSLMFSGFLIPSFAVGRIPADTLSSATTIVNKTIQYENAPPAAGSPYYNKAAIAGEFQWDDGCGAGCDPNREARTFITAAEAVRNAAAGRGKTVDRLYKKQTGATPKKFNDGTALPSGILESNGFAWTANNTGIKNAIQNGRFLVFHRDHGGISGWSTPGFNTGDIAGLTNSALPLVWSINCATGTFDGAGFSFAEQFVRRSGGGAAAVIAASRNSPSLANTYLSKALAHTAFRNVLSDFPLSSPILEIGDALNLAKIYLALTYTDAAIGDGASDTVKKQYRLYNVFGDPTLKLYLAPPA